MNTQRFLVSLAAAFLIASLGQAAEPKKLLLLGQKPDGHPPGTHEYMPGQRVLAKCLAGVKEIECKIVQADDPWLEGPELLKNADGVVLFASEGARWMHGDARRLEAFERLAARGGGLVVLHWGMGTREAQYIDRFLKLFGGCHGGPDRKYRVIDDAEVRIAARDHPITRGIEGFRIQDEFYYRLKFVKAASAPESASRATAIQPLLQVPIDGQLETVAWSWNRPDGGRSFGFSGLHSHANWRRVEYRRLVAQSVLWTMKLSVPCDGLAVDVTEDDLQLK